MYDGFDLSVVQIATGMNKGHVTFRMEDVDGHILTLDVSYLNADGYDDAVKQAAQKLERIAAALAAEAS